MAAGTNEDVSRTSEDTSSVCYTECRTSRRNGDKKGVGEKCVSLCLHEMQRGAADTQRVCRYLT